MLEFVVEKLSNSYFFKEFSKKEKKDGLLLLLTTFRDRWFVYRNTIVVYLRLTDESLERIKKGEVDLTKGRQLLPLFSEEGENTHVIACVSDSVRDMMFLRKYLMKKSLSWFKRDMKRLFIKERREKCLR